MLLTLWVWAQPLSHVWLFVTPWTDCRPPGSSVYGIFQARTLECVATYYSRGSSRPWNQTHVSCAFCIGRQILYHWVTWDALLTLVSHKKWVWATAVKVPCPLLLLGKDCLLNVFCSFFTWTSYLQSKTPSFYFIPVPGHRTEKKILHPRFLKLSLPCLTPCHMVILLKSSSNPSATLDHWAFKD